MNSNDWITCVLPVLFVIGVAAIMLALSYVNIQRRRQAWGALAQRTGLTLEPGRFIFSAPQVSGQYRGRTVELFTVTHRHGKSSITYTRWYVSTNAPPDMQLSISNEGLLSKVGKAVGMQDIQTGDGDLDRRFIIKGKPEAVVAQLMAGASVRDKLLQTRSLDINLADSCLRFSTVGALLDVEYLHLLLDLLCDLADAIERAGQYF